MPFTNSSSSPDELLLIFILYADTLLYFRQVVNGLPIIGSWWLLLLAVTFTVIVWRYPDGIWGMITNATSRLRSIGGEK